MIKNIIKKVLKESYEDYILYDVMNRDRDDPEKIKYQKIIKQIESPESHEGENWSEKERSFLKKSLNNVRVPGYKEVDTSTRKSNTIKTAISSAETTLDKIKSILSDENYNPKNSDCVTKLQDLSDELENVKDNPEDKLLKGKGLEIMFIIQKEIDDTLNKCSFTRK